MRCCRIHQVGTRCAAVAVGQVEQGGIDGVDGEVAPQGELRTQPVRDGVAEAALARAAVQQGQMESGS